MNKKLLFGILIVALLLEVADAQGNGYRRGYRAGGGKLRRIFRKNGKRWGCEDTRGRGGGMGSSSADTSDDLSDNWSNECLDD